MSTLSVNTRVEYLYRDAANWKIWGEFWLQGQITFAIVEPFLHDNLWFVPEAIGIKSLTPNPRSEDDHCLHEMISFDNVPAGVPVLTTDQFIARLVDAKRTGWMSLLTW